MSVYAVLFRGIGGQTQLPVNKLVPVLEEAGFEQARTYINSGNAIVKTRLGRDAAHRKIVAVCKAEFGFDKEIFLVDRTEWHRLIEQNPFGDATSEPTRLHAFILSEEPDKARFENFAARATDERIALKGRHLYLHTPSLFSQSKLPAVLDRQLDVVSTARNWNTVLKLGELLDAVK